MPKSIVHTNQYSTEHTLVNGTVGPVLDITAQQTRPRLLNASTDRSYSFGLSNDRPFTMIASDGGLLDRPTHPPRLLLTPGERAEILVSMRPNETMTLRSYPQNLGLSQRVSHKTGANDTLDILRLHAGEHLTSSPAVPVQLAAISGLETSVIKHTREFELGNNSINGKTVDMQRIDEVVTVDTTEMWDIWNAHKMPHNFHIHDVQFQILDIGGQEPPPELSGWKDTVYVPPEVHLRLMLRLSDYTDTDTPYMYHCHLLWHKDQGMMGQSVVVEPGQQLNPSDQNHEQHQ